MLGSLDPAKVLVILIVALVVLGPERLPKAARQLGAAWRELTRMRDQVTEEVRTAIPDLGLPRIPPGAVSGFVRELTNAPGPRAVAEPGDAGGDPGELVPADAAGAPRRPAASPAGPVAPLATDDPGMN